MKDPQISWHITERKSSNLIDGEYFAGAYSPSDTEAIFDLQVWNNIWGTEDVSDIENPILVLMFNCIEDSKLLQYCKVSIDNGIYQDLEILEDRALIAIDRILSGKANKGSEADANNYVKIAVKFGPISYGMKTGLKSLLIDLQYNK